MDTGLGSIPHVGVLRWDTSRMVLEEQNSSAVVALAGPLEPELRRLVGAKVWIVGPVLGPESIEVLAFGVILPAGARP
jgi:hypothetical protein